MKRVFHFSYIGVTDRTPPPVVIGSSQAAIDEFLALHRQEAALAYAQEVVASSEEVLCISQALQGELSSKPTDLAAQPAEVVLLGDWTVQKEVSTHLTAKAALPVLKMSADCLKKHAQSADALNGLIAFVSKQVGTP